MSFFFNDTATTEIYTLSLHDALPISIGNNLLTLVSNMFTNLNLTDMETCYKMVRADLLKRDRKSTRLNSSHGYISYAVFCLKKKKKNKNVQHILHDNP